MHNYFILICKYWPNIRHLMTCHMPTWQGMLSTFSYYLQHATTTKTVFLRMGKWCPIHIEALSFDKVKVIMRYIKLSMLLTIPWCTINKTLNSVHFSHCTFHIISQQTPFISINNTNWFSVKMLAHCAVCEVKTEFLILFTLMFVSKKLLAVDFRCWFVLFSLVALRPERWPVVILLVKAV
jgi:hypothetical protein